MVSWTGWIWTRWILVVSLAKKLWIVLSPLSACEAGREDVRGTIAVDSLGWMRLRQPRHENPLHSAAPWCRSPAKHSARLFYTTDKRDDAAFQFLQFHETSKQFIQLTKSCVWRAVLTKRRMNILRGHFYLACSCLKTTAAARARSLWVLFPTKQELPTFPAPKESRDCPMLNLQRKET